MVQRRIRTAEAATRGRAAQAEEAARPAPRSSRRAGTEEHEARGFVATSSSHKRTVYDETEKQVHLTPREFEPGYTPAVVRVGAGLTINMGDFNSLRIDCSVSLPCRVEGVAEAYEEAAAFVAEKLDEEQVRWLGTNGTTRR